MRHFELQEFLVSDTARSRRIDNYPGFAEVDNLRDLCEGVLDPLREAWGSALNVTSGYRCPKLNKAVGGVSNSVHQKGLAADIVPARGTVEDFVRFAEAWLKENRVAFDQSILEKDSKGAKWWHIGLRSNDGRQRGQLLALTKK